MAKLLVLSLKSLPSLLLTAPLLFSASVLSLLAPDPRTEITVVLLPTEKVENSFSIKKKIYP